MEPDFFNPRSIVVFICILQGAVFAALLFLRFFKNKNKSDFWLAALLIFFCLSVVTPLIGFANVYDHNKWLTYFPFSVTYIYGVCVRFYVLNLTDSKREFKRTDLLLFIPSLIYLIFRFTLFAQSAEFKARFDDIAEVRKKLENGEAKNLTLLGIAFESGFNSKATFNRAFRKFTGISPKEYQNEKDSKP